MNNKFKRLLAVLFSLSMVFCLMSANAWATQPRTVPATLYIDNSAGENHFDDLASAVSNAIDGDTIQLGKNVALTNGVDIGKNITLDLNSFTISDGAGFNYYNGTTGDDYLFAVLHGGKLTVDDTSAGHSGKITLAGSGIKCFTTIKMTKKDDGGEANSATLVVNNGSIEGRDFAVSGNGNSGRGNVQITVNGGTIKNTKTTGTGDDAAIYMPNTGSVTLNGGTIDGLTGVELRSGDLTIPKGSTVEITGRGYPATYSGNNNGTTTFGVGVAVAQHTTGHAINVRIEDGKITGAYALAVVNPNDMTGNNISVSVAGGTFTGSGQNGEAVKIDDTRFDNTKFITGGIFSSNPAKTYIADGYAAVQKVNDGQLQNLWTVGCAINLNQNRPEAFAREPLNRQVVGEVRKDLKLPEDGDTIEWACDVHDNPSGHETHNYSLSGWTLTGWATTQEVTANETVNTGSFTIPAAWAGEDDMEVKTLYGRWTVNAPGAPAVASVSSDAITVTAVNGVEYSIDGGETWTTTATFNGLKPETQYTISARKVLVGDEDALKGVVERKTAETKATTSAEPVKVDNKNDNVDVVTESTAVAATADETKGIVASEDNKAATITVEQANEIASGTEAVSGLEDAQVVQDIVNGDYNKVVGVDAPADGNKLVVVPSITVETKGFSVEGDKKVLELDIKATYTVYEADQNATTLTEAKQGKAKASGTLDTTGKDVEMKIKLPDGFANVGETLYIKHTKETGKNAGRTFMYTAKVTEDSNGNRYAEFVNPDGFSPFAVQNTSDGAPYLVNGTPKNTLKEAVEAVLAATGTDLTINVATNTDVATETDIITVNQKTTFKINATGNKTVTKTLMEQRIVAGTGIIRTLTEASGVYTFTFEYPGTIIVPSDPTPTTTKPAAPATPVIKEVTDKSIVVNAVAGVEYSIDGGKTWKSAKAGEATVTFDGLTPETTYTVSARVAKTDKAEASDVVTVNATTKKTETATGTDTPTPTPGPEPEPTPVPTPAPTNPTYDSLSSKEKKNAKAVAKALGVDNETAAQMIKEAAKLGVSIDTVKLGTKTILALKNDNDPKGADFGKLTARATKRTNKAVTLGWKKQKNADGYMIYGNVCGKKYKLLKTIKKKGTTSWTQKKLKKGTNYKYLVVAYKNVNGEKMPIAAAVVVHTNTKGGKVTVAKSLKLNKTKVTVKKGKSFTLKATEVKEDKNLKIKSHRKVKFESSNKKIAKVSSKGKITGVKKGTVTIFAYAQNGIYKTVKVTVK